MLGDIQAEAPPRGSPQVPESLATFESKFCHSPGPRGAGPLGLLLAPPPALCPNLGPPHPALCLLPHAPSHSLPSSVSSLFLIGALEALGGPRWQGRWGQVTMATCKV